MSNIYPIEQKLVPFNGAELLGVKANDGKIYVGIRWVCDGIGLSRGQANNEVNRVQTDIVLREGARNFVLQKMGNGKGSVSDALTIELESLPLWLAKISITPSMQRYRPEVTEKLVQYQLKAKNVLASAFIQYTPSYQIDDPIARAERWIEETKEKKMLVETIEEQKPLVSFAEICMQSDESVKVRDLAHSLSSHGFKIGQNRLFDKLREWKLICQNSTEPTQRAVEQGLFEVVTGVKQKPTGEPFTWRTPYITVKGQVYVTDRLRKEYGE